MTAPASLRRPRERSLIFILAVLLLAYLLLGTGTRVVVEGLWFQELGHLDVFRTRLGTQIVLGVLGFAIAFAVLSSTVLAALRRSPSLQLSVRGDIDVSLLRLERRLPLIAILAAGVVSLGLASTLAREWLTVQAFLHRVPYGESEPIFSRDIGFYLFTLPVLRLFHGWLMLLLILSVVGSGGIYALRGTFVERRGVPAPVRRHLGTLGVVFLVLLGMHYALAQFDVLLSPHGTVHGAGFTDVKAGLPGLRTLIVAALAASAVLAWGVARGRTVWMIAAPAGFVLVYLLAVVVVPGGVQRLVVEPNELSKEKPYLEHALHLTREAYDLEDIEERSFDVAGSIDATLLRARRAEVENIRLWDDRPLLATYRQLQEIRLYYHFGNVDIDRYEIDGLYRQVMLSARELAYDQIPQEARTWVNLHLKYTHGYGLCMSPVNRITPEGLPELLIRDIPPVSLVDLEITRPEIYYGEQSTAFALVLTTEDEFDYPVGEANRFTRYAGRGGIGIGSLLRRLLFAWQLRSRELLFTGALTRESRILLHRSVRERVQKIAPFLRYDGNPYLALYEGRMMWILDAYTFSDRFPYSQPAGDINYIRNAVKVVVDAYHGTTTFYVADPEDAVLRTYRGVFPSLFRPLDAMPDDLRAHVRYPMDLFRIQAETYATFHMDDPQVFYNKEDLWQLPIESVAGREVIMEPYYTIMQLPDSEREEMILMLPFTPARKDNMIAWMAARCDGDNLGRRLVFLFPKQELVYGPRQIEARIDQDTAISQQITLWSQAGSNVNRGNLLVIPIAESVLYVEPLFLQAEKGALPELKRVVLAHGNRIEMDTDLDSTLRALFGAGRQMSRRDQPPTEETGRAGAAARQPAQEMSAARRALEILQAAEEALRRSDWARYGEEMQRLRRHLETEVGPEEPTL